MIVCYIAGPYTATEQFTVEQNIDNARMVASEIRKAGLAAIVPHLESMGCAEALDYEGWIEHGLAIQAKCDCIVLLKGWMHSNGATREYNKAVELRQPMFRSYSDDYIYDIVDFFGMRDD